MLELENVRKSFDGFAAVDGCSYTVPPNTITCLIGPNGAGKTTSVNLVSGLLAPTSGEIRFNGQRIDRLGARQIARLGIGRTFQVPRELNTITVLESLKMSPENDDLETLTAALFRRRAVAEKEAALERHALTVLDTIGLSEKRDNAVSALSGGQKKLLELGRALAFGAKLILLDEPTAGVNPTLIDHLSSVLIKLKGEGYTFLIVEHNMEFIATVADKVIMMAEGKTLIEDTFESVRQHPEVIDAYLGGVAQ